MRHKVKPSIVAIEKKSTGVTFVSQIREIQGLNVVEIERSVASGSKIDRYIKIQPYLARKQITFSKYARHAEMCISHMSKITANNSHRHDDIADTCHDAVDMGLIRNVISGFTQKNTIKSSQLDRFKESEIRLRRLRATARRN
ncbi:MAG: hypothetical protein ACTHME_05250 [Candidatus Nitrosocosmicus sp.]